jgi:hypothetical protein
MESDFDVYWTFRYRSGSEKSRQNLSLGLLFIAVQLPDLVYGGTLLTGIEKVSFIAGSNSLTSVQYFYLYSHSLVGTLLWSGLVALIVLLAPLKSSLPKSKAALVMAVAVLSHFILVAIVHNSDLDLLGNGAYKIGLGLGNYHFASYLVEAILLVLGLWIYLRATKSHGFIGKFGSPILCLILLILNGINRFGPTPTSTVYFAVMMLVVDLGIVIAAFWLNGERS